MEALLNTMEEKRALWGNILPEFEIIFGKTMCMASTEDGHCYKVIPLGHSGCPKHPLIQIVPQRGFPQLYPLKSVDFSHFDLISRPVPSIEDCVDIIRSKKIPKIAQLAADIQRMKEEQVDIYDAMIEASIKLGDLQSLEIFWQSTYYYDRSSPYYSFDLIKASWWGSFRTFKHILSAFIHYSSVCPEEITYDELAALASPKVLKFLNTIPFAGDDDVTPDDLRKWCGCKTCKSYGGVLL